MKKEFLAVTALIACTGGACGDVVLKARPMSKPPVIDGHLEEAWESAGRTERFYDAGSGGPAHVPTDGYVGFDEESLYIAFRCHEPGMAGLRADVTEHDGPVWEDDAVELFVDTNHDRIHYAHFMLSARGTKADENCEQGGRLKSGIADQGWNPAWDAAVARGESSWTAELRIPLSELGLGLNTGARWGINLCRQRYGKEPGDRTESTATSPTFSGFHAPAHFAVLDIPYDYARYARKAFTDGTTRMEQDLADLDRLLAASPASGPHVDALATGRTAAGEMLAVLRQDVQALDAGSEQKDAFVRRYNALTENVAGLKRGIRMLKWMARMGEVYPGPASPFGLAIVDTATKVLLDDDLLPAIGSSAMISLAGNETEGFQLVILPFGQSLPDVTVKVADLHGPDGSVLAAQHVSVHPVGYVRTKSSPLEVSFLGWTPDVLLAAGPFAVTDHVQPVWINVHVPSGLKQGVYRGAVAVSAAGTTREVALEVEVYGFDLPVRSTLRTAFHFAGEAVPPHHPGETPDEVIRQYYEAILAHRISPIGLYSRAPSPPQPYLDLCMARGQNVITLGGLGAPVTDLLAIDYHNVVKTRGWNDELLFYVCDEPGPSQYPGILGQAEKVKKTFPDVERFGAVAPVEGLFGALDIWVPVMGTFGSYYRKDACDARKAAGEQVWMYVCCDPVPPYPNLMMDNDGIDPRIIPWMLWREQLTGLLYYYINHWAGNTPGRTEFSTAGDLLFETWDTYSHKDYNGDGMLMYPGPLSSTRLENLRDGVEDYEYLSILRGLVDSKRPGLTAEQIGKAEACLAVDESIVSDFTVFTKDLAVLRAKRVQVARMIEELLAAGP